MVLMTSEAGPQSPIDPINLSETLRNCSSEGLNITSDMLRTIAVPPEFPDNKVAGVPIKETIHLPNYKLDLTNRIITAKGNIGQILLSSVYGNAGIDQIKEASAFAYNWAETCAREEEKPFLISLVWNGCTLPKLDLLRNAGELNGMLRAVAQAGGWTTDIGEGSKINNFFTMFVDRFSGTVTHKAVNVQVGLQIIADNG